MSYYNDSYDDSYIYGGEVWGTKFNNTGLMGFVDSLWVFLMRVVTLIALILLCIGVFKFVFSDIKLSNVNIGNTDYSTGD